ncbi:hypothetical protein TWF569_006491 [Orbilia oligospora]|uniref:Nephrocystin 3-like N-terminal domain-containing protein n=1 Tax=Orbilia oligospora TaxID=2813651 RepID=A0A7C8J6L0_ORBOL|nr:hypothetical protein TWF102_001693 [Orbilia oligospora]KAF3092050.1 hypothetical protein TWF103_011350 [Orbilia oligospora]KAF3145942.1 hypothetical protein TWF569_006491 [Orbilia oligospora]
MHRPLTREAYSIGWICAIQIELAAALAVLDEVLPESPFDMIQGDPNLYYFGRIQNHDIVITCLPAGIMGIASASMVASNMMRSFPGVRRGFGLMVGVGGGAPNLRDGHDIRLGDVVISQPNGPHPSVVQYDFGKSIERGQFIQTGQLDSPPRVLLCTLSALKARDPADFGRTIREQAQQIGAEDQRFQCPQSPDYLFKADYFHIPDESLENSATCSRCDLTKVVVRPERNANYPHFHYGTIASANQVMKDGVKRDTISEKTGALSFEMEAAGLMNDFNCLVIRGICDYSDGHKNKSWQPYAALVAAIYTKELLKLIPEAIDPEDAFGRDNVTRVVKWLAADSPQEEHDTRISDTVDGTCRWILKRKECKDWKTEEDPEARRLWIYGKASTGKSVLAANIIKDIKDSTFPPCVFYFSIHESLAKRDPLSILRSWLSQLATISCRAFKMLKSMREGNGERTITELELWSLFENCLRELDLCYLVVDGYDETFNDIASRRSQVRGAREVFSRKVVERMKGTRARLLITSRDEVDIRRSLLEFNDTVLILTMTIEIRPGDTLGDLYKFCGSIVDERLKSSKLDDNDKEVTADRLAQNLMECLSGPG